MPARDCSRRGYRKKRPASRDLSGGLRLGEPIEVPENERPRRRTDIINARPIEGVYDNPKGRTPMAEPEQIFSSRCRTEQAAAEAGCKLFFLANDVRPGIQWWSRTGSNRRPPACKAGALPAELRPLLDE